MGFSAKASVCWLLALICAGAAFPLASGMQLYAGGRGWAPQFDGVQDFMSITEPIPLQPMTIELLVHAFLIMHNI